jgi:hypothetical protein
MGIKPLRKQLSLGDLKLHLIALLADLPKLAGDARDRKMGS